MIEIARPWMFALLVALPLLWLGMRRSIAAWTSPQRRICTAVRILLLALIVLALAGLRVLRPSAETAVLFVVDGSASVSPEAANSAREFVAKALASKGGRFRSFRPPSVVQPPFAHKQRKCCDCEPLP